MTDTIQTPITKLFGIKYPIILAGMHIAASPKLAAAVSNAGGLGVLGAIACRTPELLANAIDELKSHLDDPNLPFGVDMALPKVGDGARKTNKAYHEGPLDAFIDVMIQKNVRLFVSAIGVPPKETVEKLHKAGIVVQNMVGAPKHVKKAIDVGADIICGQGGEGGGHTGSTPTSLLIPEIVDQVKGHKSPLTGEPVQVVAAGGIHNGRGLVAALAWGASAVWVGTRFVASEESGAPPDHKQHVLDAQWDQTVRTLVFSGRPMRVFRSKYVDDWETNRQQEIKDLTSKGIVPWEYDMEHNDNLESVDGFTRFLMGEVSARIKDVPPAKKIIEDFMREANESITRINGFKAKL